MSDRSGVCGACHGHCGGGDIRGYDGGCGGGDDLSIPKKEK